MPAPRTVDDHLALLETGLGPRATRPARVIVVGAGMAGLMAASELARAGHDPIVLETRQRVGGRILTLREPFAPGRWAEAGAMRIPRSHRLTMALVQRFGLDEAPFTSDNQQAYCCFGGGRLRMADVPGDPEALGFDVADHERSHTAAELWAAALEPFAARVAADGDAAWAAIAAEHDHLAVREFLELQQWSEGAIELFGLLFNQEAMMNSSFVELLREELGGYYSDLVYIVGGTDLLPRAFLPEFSGSDPLRRQSGRARAIDRRRDRALPHRRGSVLGDGRRRDRHRPVPRAAPRRSAPRLLPGEATGDPPAALRRVREGVPPVPAALREEDDGIVGGGSVTDLAVRNVYYPDHGGDTGRGVVLASYTWGEDAQRWGSLSPDDRIGQALEDVARIHPQAPEEFEVGASKMWHDDEFAGGAFALFDPGQQKLLQEAIVAPEGRVHFAGEHASLAHALDPRCDRVRPARRVEVHAITATRA